MSSFLSDIVNLTDITELKAVSSTSRRDGEFRFVKNAEIDNLPILYRFDISSSADELLPIVVEPTDEVGRWLAVSERNIYRTVAPTGVPSFKGLNWIANLTNPTRTITWISTDTDWVAIENRIITLSAPPVFNADYLGQKVLNTANNTLYMATNLTGTWIALN